MYRYLVKNSIYLQVAVGLDRVSKKRKGKCPTFLFASYTKVDDATSTAKTNLSMFGHTHNVTIILKKNDNISLLYKKETINHP